MKTALNEIYQAYFTDAISPLKVSGLFIARSARIFLSRAIPFFESLLMNSE
jgi:hypothetical protein